MAQISMDIGGASGGAIRIGEAATTTCDAAADGAIRYDATNKYHQFCDGTDWRQLISQTGSGAPSLPPAGNGYFVLTNATYDGSLGGSAGARTLCLADLTANDWLGKAGATVNATTVFPFLCTGNSSGSCDHPLPSVTYHFAI